MMNDNYFNKPLNGEKTLLTFATILIGIILIFIAGSRPIGLDKDIFSYQYNVLNYSGLGTANFLNRAPFFWFIVELNKLLFGGQFRSFLFIYAILGVCFNLYAIKRLSANPLLSIFIYTCTFFILHEMTQIRVGVAAGIIMLAIRDIHYRNAKSYLLKISLAFMFHYSAIVALPFYFLKPKHINVKLYLILPLLGLAFAVILHQYGDTILRMIVLILPDILSHKLNIYLNLSRSGIGNNINIYNSYYSSLFIIYYFSILHINKFHFKFDILFVEILGWTLFAFYFFSFLPVLSFRIAEISGMVIIFLLPSLVLIFKQKLFMMGAVVIYALLVFVNNIFIHHLLHISIGI